MDDPDAESLTDEELILQDSRREKRQLILKSREVTKQFLAFKSNRKLFGPDHVSTFSTKEKMMESMEEYFQKAEALEMVIGITGVTILDSPVIEVNNPQESPFYPLLVDEIAGVRILGGVTSKELGTLADALLLNPNIDIEESASTLLWDAELDHIQIIRRELFETSEKDSTFNNRFQNFLTDVLSDDVDQNRELPRWVATKALGEESESTFDFQMPSEESGPALIKQSTTLEEFHDSITETPEDASELKYAQILLDALPGVDDKSLLTNASNTLFSVALHCTQSGDFDNAALVLDRTHTFLEAHPEIPLVPETRGGEYAVAWLRGLRSFRGGGEVMAQLWNTTPDEVQTTVLDYIITTPLPEVLELMAAHLTQAGEDTARIIKHHIDKAPVEIASHLISLTGAVLGKAGSTTMAQAIHHPSPKMRRAALRAVLGFDLEEGLKCAGGLLADPDKSLRREATSLIDEKGSDEHVPYFRTLFETEEFIEFDLYEKTNAFVTLLKLAPGRGRRVVMSYASNTGLLGNHLTRTTSDAAILALGRSGDLSAEAFIKEQSEVRLILPPRKAACKLALSLLNAAKERAAEPPEEN